MLFGKQTKQSEQDDSGNPVWKQYRQSTPGSVQPCAKFSSRVKCKRGGTILQNFLTAWKTKIYLQGPLPENSYNNFVQIRKKHYSRQTNYKMASGRQIS